MIMEKTHKTMTTNPLLYKYTKIWGFQKFEIYYSGGRQSH